LPANFLVGQILAAVKAARTAGSLRSALTAAAACLKKQPRAKEQNKKSLFYQLDLLPAFRMRSIQPYGNVED
jgi:type II secretory pathway component PulF